MMARLLSRATITSMYRLLSVGVVLFATSAYVSQTHAGFVNFGTGANQFTMEFVTIGNPGNAPDIAGSPNPAGAVAYEYSMGKFEVSETMINKFNASQSLQITMDTRGLDSPATNVSWNEAARFVNWLNTSTGHAAAYKFTTSDVNDNIELWTLGDAGYDPSNPYRNSLAKYVLPTYNEWYKAAYYNPVDNNYYDFPNGSNTAPAPIFAGNSDNTAVYSFSFSQGPAGVFHTGGVSPYGAQGLGGNVFEWDESSSDLTNNLASDFRGLRGGSWWSDSGRLSRLFRSTAAPTYSQLDIGFRVAMLPDAPVPEPSTLVIGTLFGLGGLLAKRRSMSARSF
jgi:formylglycine-generating enzyme